MIGKLPELMSPVKDFSGLIAASPYADAVYFGVADYNLRANSQGITIENLVDFVSLCHEKGLKAYMTVNSTLYDPDIPKVKSLIENAKRAEVDALIVWDPAAIRQAKEVGLDFFISTQANVSNSEAAQFYADLGAKRVILAREMSLEQIKKVVSDVDVEVEVFVHGAMCLALSGRCVLSGFYSSSSANRGACSQPCRRKWRIIDDEKNILETDGKNYLSPKDICMIEYIPELIESGVHSFKIEGRQRDSRYVSETARLYRKAMEAYSEGRFLKREATYWKEDLRRVYNRDFSTGFYFGEPGKEGINFNVSGNASTIKKLQVGKVTHYYPKSGAASLRLIHRGLSVGDEIVIEGQTTYLNQKISSIEVEGESIEKGLRGEEIGLKVNERVREGDEVFLITD